MHLHNKNTIFFAIISSFFIATILIYSSAFAADDHKISFMNPMWDGKKIPIGMECTTQGGKNPHTPKLKVTNLPKGTSYLRMVITDESYGGEGFHGIFRIKVPLGSSELVIPRIYESAKTFPAGITLEKGTGAPELSQSGNYLPPCSNRRNHNYFAEILPYNSDDEKLKENYIDFGRY